VWISVDGRRAHGLAGERGRRASARSGRRLSPGVESLESRRLLSVTTQFARAIDSVKAPLSVSTDPSGNTIVAGEYDNGSVALPPLRTYSDAASYVAKMDGSGKGLWLKNIDGLFSVSATTDASGYVYALGFTQGTRAIVENPYGADDDPLTMNQKGDIMVQLIRFSSPGDYYSGTLFQSYKVNADTSISQGSATPGSIATDARGNVFIAGAASTDLYVVPSDADASAEPRRIIAATGNSSYPFVIKIDPRGNVLWATAIPARLGSASDGSPQIAVDPAGNPYVADALTRDSTIAGTVLNPPGGSQDVYLAKLDGAGGGIVWASKVAEGTIVSGHDLAVDGAGRAYVGGGFQGTLEVGTASLSSDGARPDAYLAGFDGNGALSWSRRFGGPGDDAATALTSDGRDQVYVAGTFQGTLDLGTTKLTSPAVTDVFLAQVDPAGNVVQARNGGGTGTYSASAASLGQSGRLTVGGTYSGQGSTRASFAGSTLATGDGMLLGQLKLARPTAVVEPLASPVHSVAFDVSWGGTSDVAIASYDVYVSTEDGPLTPWLLHTDQTRTTFQGADGLRYGFAVVATDSSGLTSALPTAPQATTLVQSTAATSVALQSSAAQVEAGQGVHFTATVTTAATWAGTPAGSVQFLVDGQPVGGPVPLDARGVATSADLATLGVGSHAVAAVFTGAGAFLPSASAAIPQAVTSSGAGGNNGGGGPVGGGDGGPGGGGSGRDGGGGAIPPPPIVVASATLVRKRRRVKGIHVTFSGALGAASAQDGRNYTLVAAGRDRKFGTRDDKKIRIARAAYDAAARMVSLTPRGKLKPGQKYQLRVSSSPTAGIRDAIGRAIDGNGDALIGDDAVVTVGR
jgi:hypothetical protein